MSGKFLEAQISEGKNTRRNRLKKRTIAQRHQRWMPIIDLHGHTYPEALVRIQKVCESILEKIINDDGYNADPFKIITGRSDVMRDLAIWKIEQNGFEISPLPDQNAGEFIVIGPKAGTIDWSKMLEMARIADIPEDKCIWNDCSDNEYYGLIRHIQNTIDGTWNPLSDWAGNETKAGNLVQIHHRYYNDEQSTFWDTEDVEWIYEEELTKMRKRKPDTEIYALRRNTKYKMDGGEGEYGNFDTDLYDLYDDIEDQELYLTTTRDQTYLVVKVLKDIILPNHDTDPQTWFVLKASNEMDSTRTLWVKGWEFKQV